MLTSLTGETRPMITTIEKEAREYGNLLKMLTPDEHDVLVRSINKIKNNINEQLGLTSDHGQNPGFHQGKPYTLDGAKHTASSDRNFEQKDRLIKNLTKGYRYSPEEKIELELETLQRYFERRRELLSNCFNTTQVAKLLGTSRQTPHDRVKNQSLLAVRDNGQWKFPIWQFDPEGADGVVDGLPEVLKNLSINSQFAKLNWFMNPNPVLDGLTPVQALKRGLKVRVIAEAMGVGGAIW